MADRSDKPAQKATDNNRASHTARSSQPSERYPASQANPNQAAERDYRAYYASYYQNMQNMYYPGYTGYGMPASQPKAEGAARQGEEADASNQHMAGMYPGMGMPSSSSAYPYGYPPYYSYPSSQYPYSYPYSSSYSYPRQYSDMYMANSAQAPQQQPSFGTSMPAYPPSSYQQRPPQVIEEPPKIEVVERLPTVKQEIVISSDEEKEKKSEKARQRQFYQAERDKYQKSMKLEKEKKKEAASAALSAKKLEKFFNNSEKEIEGLAQKQSQKLEQINKANEELSKPFYKSRKINKGDQDYKGRSFKQTREKDRVQKAEAQAEPPQPQPVLQLKDQRVLNDKIAASLKSFETKPLFNKPAPKPPIEQKPQTSAHIEAEAVVAEKQNVKKQRQKDDHPLKELRYNESHGKIRVGAFFQSSLPDLLPSSSITALRSRLHGKLQQREIAALTF